MKIFKENFWEQVFIKVTSNIIVSLVTFLVTIAIVILISIYDPLKNILAQYLSISVLIVLLLILIILLGLSITYISFLRKQLKPSLIIVFGIYWDKKCNPYCPSCKTLLTNYAFYSSGNRHLPGMKCISCDKVIHFSDEFDLFHKLGEARKIVQEIFDKKK